MKNWRMPLALIVLLGFAAAVAGVLLLPTRALKEEVMTSNTPPSTDKARDSTKARSVAVRTLQMRPKPKDMEEKVSVFKKLFWACMKQAPSKDPNKMIARQSLCRKKSQAFLKKVYWICIGEVTRADPAYEQYCRKKSLDALHDGMMADTSN